MSKQMMLVRCCWLMRKSSNKFKKRFRLAYICTSQIRAYLHLFSVFNILCDVALIVGKTPQHCSGVVTWVVDVG